MQQPCLHSLLMLCKTADREPAGKPGATAHLPLKVRGRPLLELLHVGVEVDEVQAAKALGEEALRDAQLVHKPGCGRGGKTQGRPNRSE